MSILSNRTSENEQNILKRFPLPKKGYQFNKILKMRKTHQQKRTNKNKLPQWNKPIFEGTFLFSCPSSRSLNTLISRAQYRSR